MGCEFSMWLLCGSWVVCNGSQVVVWGFISNDFAVVICDWEPGYCGGYWVCSATATTWVWFRRATTCLRWRICLLLSLIVVVFEFFVFCFNLLYVTIKFECNQTQENKPFFLKLFTSEIFYVGKYFTMKQMESCNKKLSLINNNNKNQIFHNRSNFKPYQISKTEIYQNLNPDQNKTKSNRQKHLSFFFFIYVFLFRSSLPSHLSLAFGSSDWRAQKSK